MADNRLLIVDGSTAELTFKRLATGPDFREGLDTFQGKRPPLFQD